ncbi:Hpt domain-containing protein [Geothrix oryzisoli]|uniref:Hpt domain-containing protein n=1 Tax=Geothrix oryzisoli TaxID=2922721 RepID=UPI0023DFF396|nr:Hpt domain-containing protein [Geothrix oryzisoli]
MPGDPLPVIDPQPLRDLLDMGAEPGLVGELIGLLEGDVPVRLAFLRTALAASDREAALPQAHQLKGALGTMGLQRFAGLVQQLEGLLREAQWEEARRLLDTFPVAYEEALAALRSTFPEA